MGPLTCFPYDLFLDVLASWDHIHGMEKLMDPLGLRDVPKSPVLFTKRDMFQIILSPLILAGQLKADDGMEKHLYELDYLLPIVNIWVMSLPPSCWGPTNHDIHGLDSLLHEGGLFHLDQEYLH
jgi:hypothetical protein